MTELLNFQGISTVLIVGLVILLSVTILRRPIKLLFRLLLNTIGGFIVLFLVNLAAPLIGVAPLSLNWLNALIVGIFGLPGVGLLLILRWLLII